MQSIQRGQRSLSLLELGQNIALLKVEKKLLTLVVPLFFVLLKCFNLEMSIVQRRGKRQQYQMLHESVSLRRV